MDAYQAIVSKRDTRDFRDDPVSEDDVRKVLQAARMAGSAKNQQVNRIVVVTDPGDRAELSKCGNLADWLPGAAVVFVLVVPKGRRQSLRPRAHGPEHARHRPFARLGIGPPAPAGDERKPSPRIPLDELVGWGHWQD